MKKFLILIVAILLFLPLAAWAGDKKPEARTYFTAPPSQTLPAYSTFNPAVTIRKDGKTVTKTYLQHQSSELFPAGSVFNPYISVTEKGPKK